MRVLSIFAAPLLARVVSAGFARGASRLVPPPLTDERGPLAKRSTGSGVFEQLLDHARPELGTFNQSYWWSDEFYAGPGSPVIFFTPGEVAAAEYVGYLTNRTITGMFAQAIGGAVILMEHRYWGDSVPFQTLSPTNLQYLTLDNAIADIIYLANNIELPFDFNGTSHPSKAPWVMSGGSYSGALSAWVKQNAPGTFWAHHASSAAQNAIYDFWQYFYPVQQGMPQNCSTDVAKVIDYVDGILQNGTDEAKQAMKNQFHLGGIVHDGDFATTLEEALWQWQSDDFTTGYSGFYQFCDYIENMFPNVTTPAPGAEGVGLEKALDGYVRWVHEFLVPDDGCGEGTDCGSSYDANSTTYTDWDASNEQRPWMWMLCNEPLAYWQDGAPEGVPSIVSRFSNAAYWQRQCPLFFPPSDGYTYGSGRGLTTDDFNAKYGGWNIDNTTRLLYVNGEFDPWRDSTVSSQFRPGGPLESTEQVPVKLVPGGIHCPDLLTDNGEANAGLAAIQAEVVEIIRGWVAEFTPEKIKQEAAL